MSGLWVDGMVALFWLVVLEDYEPCLEGRVRLIAALVCLVLCCAQACH